MTAYAVFIRDRITDEAEMKTYGEKAGASTSGVAVKPLAFYGANETLEGPKVDGVVILEFPDMAAAKGWYNSPAYQDAKPHRLRGADYRVVLVEGM